MFTERLHQLRRELDDDSKAAVIGLTDPTMDALDATRVREATYDKLAQNVQANATDEDVRTVPDEYLRMVTRAEENRATAIQAVIGYLGGDVSGGDAATTVDDAIVTEDSLDAAIEGLVETKEVVSVPAILAITGPETLEAPKGVAVSETYTVSNLGAEAATDVTTSVESDLALSMTPAQLGALDPDEEVTMTVSGTSTTEGKHGVKLSAAAGSVGDVHAVTAVVADKLDYLSRALVQVDTLKGTIAGIRLDGDENRRDKGRHENGRGRDERSNGWDSRSDGRNDMTRNRDSRERRWHGGAGGRGGEDRGRGDGEDEDGALNSHEKYRYRRNRRRHDLEEHPGDRDRGRNDRESGRFGRGSERYERGRGRNDLRGVEHKFRIVEQRIERLIKRLEQGNGRGRGYGTSINHRIGTAVHTLEATENQIEGLRPQQISAGDARLVTNDIEATITTLQTARAAEP